MEYHLSASAIFPHSVLRIATSWTHRSLSLMSVSNPSKQICKAANFDIRRMPDLPSPDFCFESSPTSLQKNYVKPGKSLWSPASLKSGRRIYLFLRQKNPLSGGFLC
ncbi:uncharacterized protein PRD47_002541 isoform 1-T2 [Ara ararauna]